MDGFENVRPQDIMLPRFALLQALSPSVVEKRGPDYVAGAVMNSLTGEIWIRADEEVEFIPLIHYVEWIRWGDRDKQEGILARSNDPASELALSSQRRDSRELPSGRKIIDVTEYHNFVVVFPSVGIDRMVVLSCCRTNHKKGRLLLGLARYRGKYPLYAGKYALSTVIEQNKTGQKYYVYNIRNAGWCPEEIYEGASKLYTMLKEASTVQTDMSGEQAEATESVVETEI